MDARRYRHYRDAVALLSALEDPSLDELMDEVEAVFLSRSATQAGVTDELERVAGILREASVLGTIEVQTASRLWQTIVACGPPALVERRASG